MNLRIINHKGRAQIEEKRFYPPFSLQADCPKCGETVEFDGYLSYPEVNTPVEVHFGHEYQEDGKYDDHEWSEKIVLRVTAELPAAIASPSVADLVLQAMPDDAVAWRLSDGSTYTAKEIASHIEAGTEIGQQYARDVLRVAVDMLKRQARSG